jgi:hypothetical protein
MASRTIGGQRWPEGTTVGAYLASGWTEAARRPAGSILASDVVSGGNVTFTDLDEDVRYVAWALSVGITFLISSASQNLPAQTRTDRERIKALEDGAAGGVGNARVLTWDTGLEAYEPVEWLQDVSVPREFVGPVDPTTVGTITLAYGDRWTPTEEPTG